MSDPLISLSGQIRKLRVLSLTLLFTIIYIVIVVIIIIIIIIIIISWVTNYSLILARNFSVNL